MLERKISIKISIYLLLFAAAFGLIYILTRHGVGSEQYIQSYSGVHPVFNMHEGIIYGI